MEEQREETKRQKRGGKGMLLTCKIVVFSTLALLAPMRSATFAKAQYKHPSIDK